MADVHPRLAALAPRPPTPPKERIEKSAKFEQESIQFTTRFSDILGTPEDSPSSSAEYFGGSSERISKRVIFSPWTEYHKPPGDNEKDNGSNNHIRVLPPSRDCKSSKSILKPYLDICTPTSTGELSALGLGGDITTMLESATQHLASPSRNSRVDAYTALLGCLSAYDDIPDLQIASDKFLKLLNCIRRDILARTEEPDRLDTQLVTQALKLLTVLVSMPDLVRSLPDDFCSFIIEQSISSLEDQALPKIVITHYMHFVTQHKLAQQHLNTERMNRIIKALDGLSGNIKGNRIVGQRIMVYKRLLTQAKPAMISCGGIWIGHLISGMLSTFKDIRSRAIMFGTEASLLLGTTRSVSQAFIDTLNRESPEGRKVVDFLASRLTEMIDSKDDGIHVPQIWSIVILFLRSRRYQLERWQHLKPWLLIIQKCFNSSDTHIKFQANLAWSRLIYAVNLDSSTSLSMIKILRQPITPQLDRKSDLRTYKTSKHNKQIARSSYCTLLYYAFRPSASHAQIDRYWDEYISQMLPSDPSINAPDINHSCNILTALFSSMQPKIWDENRANANGPVKADELPCIDPKWVRSRAAEILKVFERLFQVADWQSRKDQEAPIVLAWRSFGTAIGEAGRKEVKVSMETMTAIAHILNTIKQFWLRDLKQKDAEGISHDVEKISHLFEEAVLKIGLIPFNEKRLTQSSQNSYEAAETPSSRSSRSQGPLSSPFVSILNLLVSTLEDFQIPKNYERVVEHLINISMRSTTSRRTQISILRDFALLITSSSCLFCRTKIIFWQLIAKSAGSVFRSRNAGEIHGDSPQYTGHEYKDAIKIMEVGVLLRSTEINVGWQELGSILVQALEQEIGDNGSILVFTEPLAETISQTQTADCNAFVLNSAVFLLKSTKWSYSRHEKERAYNLLWGVNPVVADKQPFFDPFKNLYSMVELLLNNSYAGFESISSTVIIDFLLAVTSMITSCPPSLAGTILKQIQKGAAAWIEDGKELIAMPTLRDDSANIYSAVKLLWATISSSIKTLPKIDSQLLLIMSTLITSGLNSRHKAIVNESVLLWNRTFGLVEGLEYPDNLQPVLLKLKTLTSIYLPNFEKMDNIEVCPPKHQVLLAELANKRKVPSSPIRFTGSQLDEEVMQPQHNTPVNRIPRSPYETKNCSTTKLSKGSPRRPSHQNQGLRATPKGGVHQDNSQIQFAAIESSPLVCEAEDPQLPTYCQKEIGDRQEHEAARMFPYLTSIGKVRNRNIDESVPKLCFENVKYPHPERDISNESPVIPGDESSNEIVGSSPTPRSNKSRSKDRTSTNEPPSPLLEELAAESGSHHDAILSASNKPIQCMPNECDRVLIHNDRLQIEESSDGGLKLDSECLVGSSDQLLEMHWRETAFSEHTNSILSTNRLDEDVVDAHPSHEVDDFATAQSELLPMSESDTAKQPTSTMQNPTTTQHFSKTAKDPVSSELIKGPDVTPYSQGESGAETQETDTSKQGNRVKVGGNSFEEFGANSCLNEDDQITAQIKRDLELAFSQAEAGARGPSPICRSKTLRVKRKNSFDSSVNAVKKPKGLSHAQNFQILVATQKSREADGGCIISQTEDMKDPVPVGVGPRQTRSRSRMTNTINSNMQRNRSRSVRSSTSNSSSCGEPRAISEDDALDVTVNPEPIDDMWNPKSSMVGKRLRPHVPSGNDQNLDEASSKNSTSPEAGRPSPYSAEMPLRNIDNPYYERISRDPQLPEGEALDAATVYNPLNDKKPTQKSSVQLEPMEKVHGIFMNAEGIGNPFERSPSRSLETFESSTHECESKAAGAQGSISKDNHESGSVENGPIGNVTVGLEEAQKPVRNATLPLAINAGQEAKPSARTILDGLRSLVEDLKRTSLGADEEREMIGLLCHSLQEVHEAGRRKNPENT